MKILLSIFFLLPAGTLKAQENTDSACRTYFREVLKTDNYGNPDKNDLRKGYDMWQYQVASTLVVIGKEIYTLNSEAYKRKKQSSEIPVIIRDENSESKIKTIIIYK